MPPINNISDNLPNLSRTSGLSPNRQKSVDVRGVRPPMSIKSERSLCHLLRVQAIFGVTYFGNLSFDSQPNLLKRLPFICYDLFFCLLLCTFEWRAFSNESFNRLFGRSSNKGIMSFVFRAAAVSIGIEYFVIKGNLAFNGSKLTSVVNSFGLYYSI